MSSSAVLTGVRRLRFLLASQRGREQSDEQLLAAFTDHRDVSAFAALVHRHGPMVLGVCRRVLGHEQDAEDAFQAAFLVLARRATFLRNKSALPSFLQGTAYHLASKAKRAAGRRRKHEGSLGALTQPRSPAGPADELLWREVRAALDEEIARLPEKYRSVFILCCLEELSQAEAGRRLGLKEGTTANRLAQARKLLAQRLARRGVELTAALAASLLAAQPASALPAGLTAATIKAALAAAAGEQWAGIVSASVAELVRGAPATMLVSKTKMAAVVLLLVSTSGSLVSWFGRASGPLAATTEPPAAKVDEKPRAVSPKREVMNSVEIQGRVLDPDGEPKAGAKILLLGEDDKLHHLGGTTVDGRFSLALPQGTKGRFLIAQAEGSGIDLLSISNRDPKKPIELRLVKDQAIRGRIVTTEGKPVRGAHVGIKDIDIYANNSLDSALAAWKKRPPFFGYPLGEKHFWSEEGELLRTTTDADGRFVLHGIGGERLATLRIRGGGIADAEIRIVTRASFDPKPYNQATRDNAPELFKRIVSGWMLHGPDVALIAEAEKPIRGIVKDADNGKGRSSVMVYLTRNENDPLGVILRTKTDAQGRFEIHGVCKTKRYLLEVFDDPSAGYVARQVWIEDSAGYDPITADIGVQKGVIVTGKIIDGATGKPIPGFAQADTLSDNPFVKQYHYTHPRAIIGGPGFSAAEDGRFRLVTIPGPVLLMGGALDRLDRIKYKKIISDPKYPQYFPKDPRGTVFLSLHGEQAMAGNFCKVLQIKPDAKIIEQDIVLERASSLSIRIQDAESKPLSGVQVAGIGPADFGPGPVIPCAEAECAAYELERDMPRLLVFFHVERKLAGTLTLKGDEKAPVTVKLCPVGSIKGQLLDADGKPLARVTVDVQYRQPVPSAVHKVVHRSKLIETDANGTFTLDNLIPQLKFELTFRHGKRKFNRETNPADSALAVKSGECREVGAITLK